MRSVTMSRELLTALLLPCIFLTPANGHTESGGADFLKSVIRRIQDDRFLTSGEEAGDYYRPTPLPEHNQYYTTDTHVAQSEEQTHGPPLSKGELLALYQAAVTKGSGLNLSALPQLPLTSEHHQHQDEVVSPSDQGTLPGYYYYFYPINSFMSENATGMMDMMNGSSHHDVMMMMDQNSMTDGDMKETRLDPLFLAMAGFVSMATIVSFSILFLPKFGDSRAQEKSVLKRVAEEDDDEMFSLSQVVGQAIQGKDCADRLACELGKAIRSMQLGQKPLRVLEVMLPPNLAKQMTQVRQHMIKKEKCQFIPCKRLKPGPQPPRNNNNKNTNKTSIKKQTKT